MFTVERHIRGKWVCGDCETLIQAPIPAHVIDKGIPTAGLLAHVMITKFADHLPLYRQESIFGRAGLAIARSTLAQWVGNCGVQLQPLVDALRDAVLTQQGGRCCDCLRPVTKDTPWHSRHVVKLSHGGTDAATNLEIYHLRCPRAGQFANVDDV